MSRMIYDMEQMIAMNVKKTPETFATLEELAFFVRIRLLTFEILCMAVRRTFRDTYVPQPHLSNCRCLFDRRRQVGRYLRWVRLRIPGFIRGRCCIS